MGYDVTLHLAKGEDIDVEDVDKVSFVSHATYGDPAHLEREVGQGLTVLYVNPSNVLGVSIEDTDAAG